MPVKIWDISPDGILTNSIHTTRRSTLRGEEFREEANALDRQLDQMLDRALELTSSVQTPGSESLAFAKRWSLGRALAESKVLDSPYLELDERKDLWTALARKCRLGIRASGEPEKDWIGLIPEREADPIYIERDVFSRGLWLQEQDLDQARLTFGSRLFNAKELHSRAAINSKQLRDALARWFDGASESRRRQLTTSKTFSHIAKALAARWPSRGPGSAKRPVHYSKNDLYAELCKVLDPLADQHQDTIIDRTLLELKDSTC